MRRVATSLQRPSAFIAALAVITLVGLALRLSLASESLFGDELATYWVVTAHNVSGVFSTVHSDAEITPPLLFVLAKASQLLGPSTEWIRLPSLIAGVATIPIVALIGLRTVGAQAALTASALTALAPFMTYYAAEARGYALMMAATALSTLAMLLALDTGRRRWWLIYALSVTTAAYSHYTCVFLLATQLGWLLVSAPSARRKAAVAIGSAALLFTPWLGGFYADLTSPTGKILAGLSPLNKHTVGVNLAHWTIGYPQPAVPLSDVPSDLGLALLAVGASLAIIKVTRRCASRNRSERGSDRTESASSRLVLVVLLAVSTPIGVVLQSSAASSIFSMRNLAASWPALAVSAGWLITCGKGKLRLGSVACIMAGLVIAAVSTQKSSNGRPNFAAAAELISSSSRAGDVVIDGTAVLDPGPLSSIDPYIDRRAGLNVVRVGAPAETDHPFTVSDPAVPPSDAIQEAVRVAEGRRIVVALTTSAEPAQREAALRATEVPKPYVLVSQQRWISKLGSPDVRIYDSRQP